MTMIQFEALSRAFFGILFATVVRSCVLAGACAMVAFFLRSRGAEVKHFLWSGVLYGLLMLPLLETAAPRVVATSRALTNAQVASLQMRGFSPARTGLEVNAVAHGSEARRSPSFSWIVLAAACYVAVAVVLPGRLALGVLQIHRIVRRSEVTADAELRELGHDVWLQSLCASKPEIRISREVSVPMTAGIVGSSILLPVSCAEWEREKVRAVLLHEMAHARRGDAAMALLASVAACLFWLHPLAYWLRRQLAGLAEEACDAAAVEFVEAERYCRILIDFVSTVGTFGRRVLPGCSVPMYRAHVERRIERVFSAPQAACRARGLSYPCKVLLIVMFVPALYLLGATRAGAPQRTNGQNAGATFAIANAHDAQEAEAYLQQHPENFDERAVLMLFYHEQGEEAEFTRHLLWIIDHQPDSSLASRTGAVFVSRDALSPAWERALASHPNSAGVLYNAGLFIEKEDPVRALTLFKRAYELTRDEMTGGERYLRAIATVYAGAVIAELHSSDPSVRLNNMSFSAGSANALKAELETSNDPKLLSATGSALVQFHEDAAGLQYLQKAVDLEPGNPAWKEALESAEAEPVRRRNMEALMALKGDAAPHPSIGAGVAAANLLQKVDPVYPSLARSARIQGDVEFTIDIGADGRVQSIQLVRGHPLLANAAKDAVVQWVYRPTLLNGQPVGVTTTIVVPFRLDQ